MNPPVSLWKVHLALGTVSLIYGFFYVAVKLLLQEVDEPQFILLRFVLTAALVAVIELGFVKTRFKSLSDFFKVAALGMLGVLLVQNLVVMGLHRTTAFHAALILSTTPMMTLMWGMMLGREAFNPKKLGGILLAFVGVALLLLNKDAGIPLPKSYLLGDLIILINAVAFSWFLIGSQSMLKHYRSFSFMAYCYMISAVLYGSFFAMGSVPLLQEPGLDFVRLLSPGGWLLVLYVVLFASIGSYTMNNYALSRISPSTVSVYIFTQPVLAAFFGFYLLGEPFNGVMALAAVVTFAGVMLAVTAREPAGKIPLRGK